MLEGVFHPSLQVPKSSNELLPKFSLCISGVPDDSCKTISNTPMCQGLILAQGQKICQKQLVYLEHY